MKQSTWKRTKLMLARTIVVGALAAIIGVAYAPVVHAFGGGFGGGGFGGVGGGFGGIGGVGAAGAHGNVAGGSYGGDLSSPGGIMINPVPSLAPQEIRELKLAGQVPANPDRLPSGSRIIQLKVNGQMIPMALDTELGGGELKFDPGNEPGEQLYHSILTKQIAVVGDSKLRDQIVQAAAANGTQALEVQGWVFNQRTPYFVVKSVEAAK
jgi:hypothetical protein